MVMDDRDLLKYCRRCIWVKSIIQRTRSGNAYFMLSCSKSISPIIKFDGGECEFIENKNWDKMPYNNIRYKKFLFPDNIGDLKHQEKYKEVKKKMVERVKAEFTPIKAFDGLIEKVEQVEGKYDNDDGETTQQYHMVMLPLDKAAVDAVKESKTQRLHNYIRISKGSEEGKIAEGSILDKFIQEIEAVLPEVEKMKTHKEVMTSIIGKKFHFVRKRLGKSYKGFEGKQVFCTQALIK